MAWVMIVFDTDVALLLTLNWVFVSWKSNDIKQRQIWYVVFLLFVWLLFTILMGSRGGPLRILNCLFLFAIAYNPRFKISVARFILIVSGFFLLNYFSFTMGTVMRGYFLEGRGLEAAVEGYEAKNREWAQFDYSSAGHITEARMAFYNSEEVKSVSFALRKIVTRLAIIDYPLIIVAKVADEKVIDHYIRSLHFLKNYANNMVPGEIFPESMVNTSRVFTMAYRGADLKAINEGFLSEPWTAWGLAWLLMGWGGLFLLFATAALIQAAYVEVRRHWRRYYLFGNVVYFILVINIGYLMFGLDHWLTSIFHFSLASLVAIAFLNVSSRVFARFVEGAPGLWRWRKSNGREG
jgi:hypothetical protein